MRTRVLPMLLSVDHERSLTSGLRRTLGDTSVHSQPNELASGTTFRGRPIQPTSPDDTDDRLIAACLAGERSAWDALVARYAGLVIGTARRAGATPTLADDVMQTVFAVLVRRLATIDDPAALPQWLIVTTKRTTWRLAKSAGVVLAHGDPAATGGSSAGGDRGSAYAGSGKESEVDHLDPTSLLLADERATAVRRAVDALGDQCRELVRALFFEQPPPDYAAISARLGVPVGSIGPTRARCLKRLGEQLQRPAGEARS